MTVLFSTIREDFPPNLENLKIQHVALYFVRKEESSIEVDNVQLYFTTKGGTGSVGSTVNSIDGIINTRNIKGSSWTPMIGFSPVGEWELALPDTKDDGGQTRDYFKNEEIEDMLFVITYSGRTPEWPV
jgi:hypothetical protein